MSTYHLHARAAAANDRVSDIGKGTTSESLVSWLQCHRPSQCAHGLVNYTVLQLEERKAAY